MSEKRIAERTSFGPSPLGYGVGNFAPGVILLVGEQAAKPDRCENQRPFCSTKGCSGWLNNQLDILSIPESRLFWVNALNNDGTAINAVELVDKLRPMAIVSLGKVAERILSEQGIWWARTMSHPQHWKRFHHNEPYPLIQLLNELI